MHKEEKINMLLELKTKLDESLLGKYPDISVENKILTALSDTIIKFNIPVIEFYKLLKAFMQDVKKSYYVSYSELIEYSDYSANPIGHLVLNLFGFRQDKDEIIFGLSDKVCTALQLINFWQDVSKDLIIKRIYIPEELMKKYNYKISDLYNKVLNDNFRELIKELVCEAKVLMLQGMKLTDFLKGRLRFEINAICNGGLLVVKKIEKINYDVINVRPALNNLDKLRILF